ncbi:hypothetical protein [Sphingobacterium pedocola]|uniref:Outer membrane protein beta-barrel domain-containing protein n=1 Tax=Sphingobacterium pedocola TaxID=2082722 RepID=A0ABR9TCX5_9SPHI|nr:hypothetical protein [Sphingobacterium pedocola]MBE8723223.1 hypothetical protein [Sphingobacterium pedocola]
MKNTLRSIFLLGTVLFFGKDAFAQLPSQHAIGARFGSATGITYRYTLAEDRAIEGIMSVQSNSRSSRFRVVGLYQWHKPITGDFSWFYGVGGSIGSYKYKAYRNAAGEQINASTELALSVDGIIGVEYNIPTTPLAVSLDVKPYFDFIQESSIRLIDPFGLSIRYKF